MEFPIGMALPQGRLCPGLLALAEKLAERNVMFGWFQRLLDAPGMAPHGYCLLWQPELIWTHVISDALIGTAYFSIPVAIAYFLIKRRDVQFGWVVWMFAIFIMACGATHFMSIWTLWRADYGIEAIIKACTALASVSTAVALWPLLPKAIALPSQAQLQSMNEDLRLRIDERDMALAALEKEKTERLATEDMLRQSQKMEAIGQLTGGIAHDFNNLLSIIIAGIERADRISSVSDERASRSLKAAIDAAEQASTLTHQLLAYSRRQTLQPVIQDLNSLVNSAAELSERTLGSNIALELDPTPQLPHVNVDGPQTVNAILNLIVNSRDAMPAGGKIKIKTYTREDTEGEEPRVVLEVSDDGLGMSRETASRAFEPYFTTKPLGKGTGLGLSQVYGFVTQSLGQIELESAESVGTVVRIILRGCKAK